MAAAKEFVFDSKKDAQFLRLLTGCYVDPYECCKYTQGQPNPYKDEEAGLPWAEAVIAQLKTRSITDVNTAYVQAITKSERAGYERIYSKPLILHIIADRGPGDVSALIQAMEIKQYAVDKRVIENPQAAITIEEQQAGYRARRGGLAFTV